MNDRLNSEIRAQRRARVLQQFNDHDCKASVLDGCQACEDYLREFDEPPHYGEEEII